MKSNNQAVVTGLAKAHAECREILTKAGFIAKDPNSFRTLTEAKDEYNSLMVCVARASQIEPVAAASPVVPPAVAAATPASAHSCPACGGSRSSASAPCGKCGRDPAAPVAAKKELKGRDRMVAAIANQIAPKPKK